MMEKNPGSGQTIQFSGHILQQGILMSKDERSHKRHSLTLQNQWLRNSVGV